MATVSAPASFVSCHGFDAQGTGDGPNIVGSSKSAISGAMGGGVLEMDDIKLTPEELDAVYLYLVFLSS
jgi:mono/diheme cytochrome c family protein